MTVQLIRLTSRTDLLDKSKAYGGLLGMVMGGT